MDVSPTINSIHGRLRSITGTNPATGAEISETVPDRRRWRLITIRFSLIVDATEIDRIVKLVLDDGTNITISIASTTAQVASQTRSYSYSPIGVTQWLSDTSFIIPLPHILLGPGYHIRTNTIDLQAGDNFAAPTLTVEEWIDP